MERRRPAGSPAEPPRQAGVPDPEQGSDDDPAAPGRRASPARSPSGLAGSAAGGSEEAAGKVGEDLDEMLEETKRERDEYLELAQRTRADFENYRKRVAADAQRAARRGKAELAQQLVPVLDNLERALAAAGIEPAAALAGEVEADGALEQGVSLTYRELRGTLERAGVEAYEPVGEAFDPTWHEALSTRSEEGTPPGTVLEVLEKGYRLDGQVIRAARVVVAE